MTTFKSSVLKYNTGEDDCPMCRFLNGERTDEGMMRVIEVLDSVLADKEKYIKLLFQSYISLHNRIDVFDK